MQLTVVDLLVDIAFQSKPAFLKKTHTHTQENLVHPPPHFPLPHTYNASRNIKLHIWHVRQWFWEKKSVTNRSCCYWKSWQQLETSAYLCVGCESKNIKYECPMIKLETQSRFCLWHAGKGSCKGGGPNRKFCSVWNYLTVTPKCSVDKNSAQSMTNPLSCSFANLNMKTFKPLLSAPVLWEKYATASSSAKSSSFTRKTKQWAVVLNEQTRSIQKLFPCYTISGCFGQLHRSTEPEFSLWIEKDFELGFEIVEFYWRIKHVWLDLIQCQKMLPSHPPPPRSLQIK